CRRHWPDRPRRLGRGRPGGRRAAVLGPDHPLLGRRAEYVDAERYPGPVDQCGLAYRAAGHATRPADQLTWAPWHRYTLKMRSVIAATATSPAAPEKRE